MKEPPSDDGYSLLRLTDIQSPFLCHDPTAKSVVKIGPSQSESGLVYHNVRISVSRPTSTKVGVICSELKFDIYVSVVTNDLMYLWECSYAVCYFDSHDACCWHCGLSSGKAG